MWQPLSVFEDEIMDIQPDHDLVFGDYAKNPPSLVDPYNEGIIPRIFRNEERIPRLSDEKNKELYVVSKIRQPIGKRLEEADLDNSTGRELETLTMMRNSGLEPSIDAPLTSKHTLPTINSSQSYKISNGCPVLLDSKYFKLKPRNPDSDSSGSNALDVSGNCTESSFLKHFKTINASEEHEVPEKPENDNENKGNVQDKTCVPDILTKMKSRRKIKLGGPAVRDKDPDKDAKTSTLPLGSSKTFFTPKELYMKKAAPKPSS